MKSRQAFLVARPRQQCAVEANTRQLADLVGDARWRAHQRIAAPAGDEVIFRAFELLLRQHAGLQAHHTDQIIHRLPVAFVAHIPVAKFQRLVVGVADHAIAIGPDLDFAAVFLSRHRAHFVDIPARRLDVHALDVDEDHVAVLGGEMAPDAGTAGIHDDRKRLLDRLRLVKASLDVEIAAVVVELVLRRPKQLQHVQPFGCVGIALVMFHDRGAKHLQLGREPAADDVQGKTAAGDVVDRRRLLGGDDRMKGRHMRGCEHRRVIRGAADTGGPGEGFKTSAVEIGDAAEAAPARNGDQGLKARVVGHAGQPLDVVPGGMEYAVDRGDRAGVVHVQAEQSELEAIVAVQSVRVTHENSRSSSR